MGAMRVWDLSFSLSPSVSCVCVCVCDRYADVCLFEAFLLTTELIGAHSGQDATELLAAFPKVQKHFNSVAALPRIAAYLASPRRRPGACVHALTTATVSARRTLFRVWRCWLF